MDDAVDALLTSRPSAPSRHYIGKRPIVKKKEKQDARAAKKECAGNEPLRSRRFASLQVVTQVTNAKRKYHLLNGRSAPVTDDNIR